MPKSVRKFCLSICSLLVCTFINAQTWNYVGSSTGISASAGTFNNIASDGINPVIAYATGNIINGSNEVKKYNGSSWNNYGSSSGFGSGHTYELKLTMDGTTPYAAWQDDWYNYYIVAAKFNGTNWQVLGNPGFSQGQVYSIDMTVSGGVPYVVYKDGTYGQITVQKFDGTSWGNVGSARFTPAVASSIISPKIVVNGGLPYVFFGDNATYGGKARLVKFDGTNWVNIGTPGFSSGTITATKLYFIGSTPYVVFTEQSANTYIKTMRYDGTNWVVVNNAQFTSNSSSSLLGIEMNDTVPYVIFSDADNSSKLSVKKFNGINWFAVGTLGFTAASVSQAALTFVNKVPHVSFNNSAAGNKVVVMKFDCTTTYGTKNVAVCSSNLPYNFNGKSINAAGTYYDTLIAGSSYGCDSITTLNLTIDNTICFKWATHFGGKYGDAGNAITTDAVNNVITVGNFVDTANFISINGSSTTLTTPNGVRTNGFISKQDNSGNILWVKNIYSTSVTQAMRVATDASNNIYVSGTFAGTADFDPSAATYNLTTVGGSYSGYIAKYDANGNFIWAKMIGGDVYTSIHSIKIDNNDNVVISGNFAGTTDFDPTAATNNITSQGDYDFFIGKLDNNGNIIWLKTIGGGGEENIKSLAIDANNNVIATGYFNSTVDFDPGATTSNLTSNTNQDIFILKLDANGNYVFAKQIGGAGYDEINCINVDAANNIYIAGDFDGTADFDPSAATNSLTSILGASFVAKYTSNGNFGWVKKFEATDGVYIYGMDVKKNGVYFSGFYASAFDANPNSGVNNLTTLSGNDIFVIKCDTSGNYVWARTYGGTSSDFSTSITVDANDNVFVAGVFNSTCDLSGIGLTAFTFTTAGNGDVFILKLGPPTSTWYLDADGDGYGNGTQNAASSPGTGWSTTAPANGSSDCDDNNNQVWRSASLFIDVDNDGYTNGTATVCYGATVPNGYKATSLGADCNDNLFNATAPVATTSTTTVNNCGSFVWNGTTYATSGSYTIHLNNVAGCDSAATLNLTVNNPTSSTTNVTSCINYTWNGVTYSSSGTYTNTGLTNSKGCDSTATLVLTISNVSISNSTATACDSYVWNGTTYTTSGNYSKTFVNGSVNGCDSVANLSLTIKQSTSSTTNISLCSHLLPYTWNGLIFTNYGSQTAHLTNSVGCDSAATLILTISNSLPAITGSNSICVGVPVTLSNAVSGGIWTSTAGRASISFTGVITGTSQGTAIIKYTITSGSCAGSVSKSITVNALPAMPSIAYAPNTPSPQTTSIGGVVSICKNRTFTLLGNPTGGVWSKTGNITISNSGVVNTGNIAGAASITYSVNSNGCNSSRTINANIVACASKAISSIPSINNSFTIYPTPTHNVVNIKADKLIGSGTIVVTDLYGKQLKVQPLSLGTNTIDVSRFAKGMYMVTIITEQGKKTEKVVVE